MAKPNGVPKMFNLFLPLKWEAGRMCGEGQTFVVSSRALFVKYSGRKRMRANRHIDLIIAWPVLFDNRLALNWHVRGRVSQSDGDWMIVAIQGYDFKICGAH